MNITQERRRRSELHRYGILDTGSEESFDRITRVAQAMLNMPIALISLVDDNRQWFKSRQGIDIIETPRDISFCTHAIQKDQPLIVSDASRDDRFKHSPLVTGAPGVRFYAGVPLKTPREINIGTLCVIDTKPRTLSPDMIEILCDLAYITVDLLELRSCVHRDSVTGLTSRKVFMLRADQEMERALQFDTNFSIVAMHVDHFDTLIDDQGHDTASAVLQQIAQICRNNIRAVDVPARFSGDVIVIMLPQTDRDRAFLTAIRIRQMIEKTVIAQSGQFLPIAISIGVADRHSCAAQNVITILNAAEDWLFEARENNNACAMPTVHQSGNAFNRSLW